MPVKNNILALSFCMGIFAGLATSCGSRQIASKGEQLTVKTMSGFPDEEEGISKGVSACYAGMLDGQLLVAGGANFPDTPAAEGGKKRYYQGIYAAGMASDSTLVWRKVGELPAPAAYGVSVTTPQGVVCVGGMNADSTLNTAYRISFEGKQQAVQIENLPSLPCTLDNLGGTLVGNVLYVAGGNADGKPSNRVFCLDLGEPSTGWQEVPAFPGPERVQPVCVGQNNASGEPQLYIWGGFASAFDGKHASLSTDGYVYSPSTKEWTPVATPVGSDSVAISLGGGTGIALSDSLILCMGGVNKDIFLSALQREEQIKKAIAGKRQATVDKLKAESKTYMQNPPEYYRFNDRICVYNTHTNQWRELYQTSLTARAGAALVGRGKQFYSINGELKPGIRTPQINKITIK